MSIPEIKICLLGETGVGKSSMAQRFVHNTFAPYIDTTIGASFMTKLFNVDNRTYKLNIWDTAGQERYRTLAPLYYRGAAACIIVYDVTSMQSFLAVRTWVELLKYNTASPPVLALAGTKSDLFERRQVSTAEAQAYANSIGAVFMETSARNSTNIGQLFANTVARIAKGSTTPPATHGLNLQQPVNKSTRKGCCGSA